MKKIIIMTLMMLCTFGYASAQNKADIKFDKTSHNFGTFSESFLFRNAHSRLQTWVTHRSL